MLQYINKLHQLAHKEERTIIGLMSGTSLDGLDIALCRIKGSGHATELEVMAFTTLDYDQEFQSQIGELFSQQQVDLQRLCMLNPYIGQVHGDMVSQCLQQWQVNSADIDLIASHGQTIYHAPRSLHGIKEMPNSTLQIGDGDHLAVNTGIITVSDFRQKHLAGGGEGAPLVAYGDELLFASKQENRVLLNIGGIANLTLLPAEDSTCRVFSSDIGPGNTMMDAYVQKHLAPMRFDEDSELARWGKVHQGLYQALLRHPFIRQPMPKTTGPESFNLDFLERALVSIGRPEINHVDMLATLNAFAARLISDAVRECQHRLRDVSLYISGGGAHNPLLVETISNQLPGIEVNSSLALNIDPDAKEAVLFALLANECVAGDGTPFADDNPSAPNVSMGKISFPG